MHKIFLISLGKMGTKSTLKALSLMGYATSHYPSDDGGFDAITVPNPDLITITSLSDKYPGSKFILNIRDSDSWLKSWFDHNEFIKSLPQHLLDSVLEHRRLKFGQTDFDSNVWLKVKENQEAELFNFFAGDRFDDFLSFNLFELSDREKWLALVRFLKHNFDTSTPFPWIS